MCLCKENNWCRAWEETQDGKYPPSEHAPGCDEYKTEKFIRITFDGSSCTIEPRELKDWLGDEDEDAYIIEDIFLTRDQYENLPEFQGF